jgi:drug/metabolite transporter (DMT)-like permease
VTAANLVTAIGVVVAVIYSAEHLPVAIASLIRSFIPVVVALGEFLKALRQLRGRK